MVAAHDWDLWSTHARLVVTDAGALDTAVPLVLGLLDRVEAAASRFRADSEILNLDPGADGTVLVSPMLADLLGEALEAARVTDGAVDPTVGGALSALGYDRDIRLIEDGAKLRAVVRPVPGWRRVRLDGRRLTLPAGVELDLGASAKAVAADRCAALVAETLGVGVLVSLGGDIATSGPAPEGGWQILVRDTPDDAATRVALPAGSAIATSSTSRRTWRRGDETLHHIVDPRTSRPADPVWRSVTVAATTCAAANRASTATIVKGRSGLAWLTGQGLPARLVDRSGVVHHSDGWPGEPTGRAA
ncbi:FAD:protein FMN transferase [Nocardioides sp.]|uniref:FAD:protein FMN transferase n=1 Tax=Nocardioides sp. TaxID=35761 RepID=UPI0031FE4C3B|nr:ApbE-like lipoprotein [Nocardioides sp.]